MHVQLPLDQMTLADKLEVMEALWADLAQRPRVLPSPDWHREPAIQISCEVLTKPLLREAIGL